MKNVYQKLTGMLLVLLTLTWSVQVSAQDRTVSGQVSSADDGEGLPGVNILIKGTSTGAVTDFNGNFSISVPSNNTVLVFSFIGYQTQEVTVGNQTSINVSLQSDVTALSEVVVIGYGEVEAKDATGAVASVKDKDFVKGVIASPQELIVGKTAGVSITQTSGEPGAAMNVRIRGTTSVRSGNQPLYVVDGVPLTNNDITAGGGGNNLGSSTPRDPLNFLNPNDIVSMDILKDASATAIYGARAANGVIIITTKKGKEGPGQLSYSYSLGISNAAQTYDLLNAQEFLAAYETFNPGGSSSIDGGANTDWQDQILRTGYTNSHNLNYGGGSAQGSYNFSMSYFDQEGVIKESGLRRFTMRFGGDRSILNDKVKIATSLSFARTHDDNVSVSDDVGFTGDLTAAAIKFNPSQPVFLTDAQGNQYLNQPSDSEPNPVAMLHLSQDFTNTLRGLGNASLDWQIIPDLSFRTVVGYDFSMSSRKAAYSRDLNVQEIIGNGRLYLNDIEQSNVLWENYFNYNKTWGNLNFGALVGYSYQKFDYATKRFEFSNFRTSDTNIMINNFASADQSSGGVVGQNSSLETDELQSFYGRFNFDISGKYLITATVRSDGSTRFGGDNKYATFPSAAFKWRISDEGFASGWGLDDLALRVGWGQTGNQAIPHNLYTQRQRYGDWDLDAGTNVTGGGLGTVAFANPNLKWEASTQTTIGIEYGFLNNRIRGVVEYYYKTTNDLLIQITSAQPAAQPFVWTNLDADVINEGVEFMINWDVLVNTGLSWTTSFNYSYNDNRVENFGGLINTGQINGQGLTGAFAQRIAEGQPLYAYFLRTFGGFDANGITVYPEGDFQQFQDGKGPIPTSTWGWTNNFAYKNFDLSFSFVGQGGFWVYDNTQNAFFTAGALANGRNVRRDVVGNGESNLNAPDVSTRFLHKGNFARFQNFILGYNFDMSSWTTISNVRLYFAGQNLALISDYPGLDPEVTANKALNGIPSLGIEYTPYPRARTFTLGVDVTF